MGADGPDAIGVTTTAAVEHAVVCAKRLEAAPRHA